MVQRKDCKKYPCDWCYSVKGCPKECHHFKHKDEVVVVRCKDCAKSHPELSRCVDKAWCARWGTNMNLDEFCSKGERRIKNE